MDMPIRNDVIRAPDIESATAVETGASPDAPLFGNLLEEARQRDRADSEDDRPQSAGDVPGAGQALVPAQPVPVARQQDAAPEAEEAAAIDGSNQTPMDSAAGTPAGTPDALSPGHFLAMLDSATAAGSAAALQSPAGDAASLTATTFVAAPSTPAETMTAMPAATATVEPHLHSPEWPAAFGNTVRLLVSDQAQVARIRLSPEDLGPVDVRITVSDNRAEIAFAVSSPEARAAIQQALPQLREALAGSGLQLGDTAFGEAQPDTGSGRETAAGGNVSGNRSDGANGSAGQATARPVATGLVDLYA